MDYRWRQKGRCFIMWKWPQNTVFEGTWRGLIGEDGKIVWHDMNSPERWTEEERMRWGVAWVEDQPQEPSLDDLYTAKMAAIQAGKNAARDGGFTLDGVLYDTDAEARLAYLELATKLVQDPSYTTPWKASKGQWVTMDAALFADLQPAYEAHIQACFVWQAEREQELAAAYAAGDRAAMEAVAETM
jgi:hypothetical protein